MSAQPQQLSSLFEHPPTAVLLLPTTANEPPAGEADGPEDDAPLPGGTDPTLDAAAALPEPVSELAAKDGAP